MTYEEYKKTKREKSAAPDTVDTSDTVYASAPKMSYTEYRKKKGLPTELTGSDSQSYHQKLGQQPSNDASAFGAEKVSVGNIKTMQRLLGTQDSGIWSEDDQKAAGGATAYDAWKDYQQGKLQSRSRSGMSMEEWSEQTSLSDHNTLETQQDLEKEKSYSLAELNYLRQLRSERDRLIEFQAMGTATPEYYDLKKRWENYYNQFDDLDERIKKLEKELWWYEREEKYNAVPKNSDFAEFSTTDPPYFKEGPLRDWTYVAVNNPTKSRRWETAAYIHGVAPIYDALNYDNLHYMNDDERAIYNYLNAKEGKKSAEEYLDYLQYDLNERSTDFWEDGAAEFAQKNPVIASLLSTPVQLLASNGIGDATMQKFKSVVTGEYKPIDFNPDAMLPARLSDTIRDNVDPEKLPILRNIRSKETAEAVYQAIINAQDSATVDVLSLIHPAVREVATAVSSDSVATQAMLDAVEKGATDNQALTVGTVRALLEMAYTKFKVGERIGGGNKAVEKIIDQIISAGLDDVFSNIEFRKKRE